MFAQREADARWCNALYRMASLQHKARAQRFMARHDAVQRSAQRDAVERAHQAQSQRHMIGAAVRIQLRQEP